MSINGGMATVHGYRQIGANWHPRLMTTGQLALRQIFQTINAESCPTTYNFHLHSTFSDGQLRPAEIIEQAINIGLKGLTITDHHSVSGYYQAQAVLDCWLWEHSHPIDEPVVVPKLWTGVEITANLLDVDVHILGYGFIPEHNDLQIYLQGHSVQRGLAYEASNVIKAIQRAGGLAVLAHPCRYRRPAEDLIQTAARLGIDGVETYYDYKRSQPWVASHDQTVLVRELSDNYDLLNTCGTDTHGPNILVRL